MFYKFNEKLFDYYNRLYFFECMKLNNFETKYAIYCCSRNMTTSEVLIKNDAIM